MTFNCSIPDIEADAIPYYITALCLFSLALLVPNSLVVAVYMRSSLLQRETSNVLLVNFCLCSLVLAGIVCPYQIGTFIVPCLVFTVRHLCILRYSLMGYVNLVNLLNSLLMVVERFFVIHFPFHANLLSTRVLTVLSTVPWLLCLALFSMHADDGMWRPGSCDSIQSTSPYTLRIPAYVLLPTVFVALVLLLRIWITAAHQQRRISAVERLAGCEAPQNRATRTLLLVAALFIICYFPAALLYFVQSVLWHEYGVRTAALDATRFAATILAMLICVICPILVLLGSSNFKMETKKMLKRT